MCQGSILWGHVVSSAGAQAPQEEHAQPSSTKFIAGQGGLKPLAESSTLGGVGVERGHSSFHGGCLLSTAVEMQRHLVSS